MVNQVKATVEGENIIPLNQNVTVVPSPRRGRPPGSAGPRSRFRLRPFTNEGGSKAWRVEGYRRDGTRIRENYADLTEAQNRQIELESEFHQNDTTMRATCLSRAQLFDAERAFAKLPEDAVLSDIVDWWLKHGKHKAVSESPRLDEAFDKFKDWLNGKSDESGNGICTLRELSRGSLRIRVNVFCNSVPNVRVSDATSDMVDNFLGKLNVSQVTRDNYRRDISRFFTWCIARPRRWVTANPCREVRVELGQKPPPAILTVEQCKNLLKAAQPVGLAPYVAVCLFSGLRPFEARRLTWEAINLADGEIRLEANQTKTKRLRIVTVCATLASWLKAYQGQPFFPSNWRKKVDGLKTAIRLEDWPVDVLRHTAISHYFRLTGSYGQTAEQFGNSEAIIKKHYQGRVGSEDTKKFYAIRPQRKGAAK